MTLPTLDPNVLAEVLAKAAPDLTDDDVDALIMTLRAERVKVLAAEAAGKAKPRSEITKAAKAASATEVLSKLSFDDLGI